MAAVWCRMHAYVVYADNAVTFGSLSPHTVMFIYAHAHVCILYIYIYIYI